MADLADIFKMAFALFSYMKICLVTDIFVNQAHFWVVLFIFDYMEKVLDFWTTLTWGCRINFWLINN
jgi:hypothetical protein